MPSIFEYHVSIKQYEHFQLSHFQIGSAAPEVEMHDFLLGGGGCHSTQDDMNVSIKQYEQ